MTNTVPLALVVDPDTDTRKLHAFAVAPVAAEVEEAEDGADALAHAVTRPPQLVITELRLPRIDGVALCGLLRRDPATCDAAIMVVTGTAAASQLERAWRAGAADVLVKPADPMAIREHARQLVGRSRELRAASAATHLRIAEQLGRSRELVERADQVRRRMLSRTYDRALTTTPPVAPPVLRCPECDQELAYDHSNVGGVSAKFPEQWDYFRCGACGTFQYRHRTRRLRRV